MNNRERWRRVRLPRLWLDWLRDVVRDANHARLGFASWMYVMVRWRGDVLPADMLPVDVEIV
ncbi:hypothetical protein [Bifidobacterium eulemuris]|nr:hypothetical protein [Bifidobacterium eulemuris]